MNLLLADRPAPSSSDRPTLTPSPGGPAEPPAVPQRSCASCGAELHGAQEWCLGCGAGAPGSLGGSTWRGPTTVILALAVLIAGAAVAGAAALTRHKAPPTVMVKTVAQTPPPVSTPPGTATGTGSTPLGTATTPGSPGTLGLNTPTSPKVSVPKIPAIGGASLPKGSPKVPALPFFGSTPKSSGTKTQPTSTAPKESTESSPSENSGNPSGAPGKETTPPAAKPTPILLDTNAASTYNPYGYPASNFSEPALAIDGDPATAWTAQVEPTVAPRLAEGLVIDLKTAHHLELLELHTATPGATVEIYGSDGHTLPASITDPAWTQLSPGHVLKKTAKLKLHSSQKAYRFVMVWLTKAPAASVGTAQAPGHVALNELALFPLASS